MNVREWRVAAAILAAVFTSSIPSIAQGQPTVPAGYTIEKYVSDVPNAKNPLGLAFSPEGVFGNRAELYVCFGNGGDGSALRQTYRIPSQGKSVFFSGPADALSAMAFSNPSSAFGSYLYGTLVNGSKIARYDASGKEEVFANFQSTNMDAMRFSSGGAWGSKLYVLMDGGQNGNSVEVFDSTGTRTTLTKGLPLMDKAMDFSPGGAWGDFLYVGSPGIIHKVAPDGATTAFLTDANVIGKSYQLSMAFDRAGGFGGDLFVSTLDSGCVYRVTPGGKVSAFASGLDFGASFGNTHTGDIVFGPDGSMYVAEGATSIVWRISTNRLGLCRDASRDTFVTASGLMILGSVADDKFVLDSPLGRLELKGRQVVGMAAGEAGAVKCLLTDGQIVVGKLAGDPVRFVPADGSAGAVTTAGFRQWSRRVSAEYPLGGLPSGPLLATADGQELLLEPNGVTGLLTSPWGRVDLDCPDIVEFVAVPAGDVAGGSAAGGAEAPAPGKRPIVVRARFTNGSILTGALEGRSVTVRTRLGGKWELPPEQVARVVSGRGEEPAPLRTQLLTDGGDAMVGTVEQEKITFRTTDGAVELDAKEIREIAATQGSPRGLRVRLWDGNEVAGQVGEGAIAFRIVPGPRVSVPQDKISLLRSVVRGSPEDLAKRVEGLIEKLGANRFQDREAATRELVSMGAAVVPLVARWRDHSDPEVRERVRLVLERLGSETPSAAGGDK